MKKTIEEIIKQSLENHELPYNKDAWESMHKRLDQVKPTNGFNTAWKYFGAAVGITTIAIASYFFFSTETISENSSSTKSTIAHNKTDETHTSNETIENTSIKDVPQNKEVIREDEQNSTASIFEEEVANEKSSWVPNDEVVDPSIQDIEDTQNNLSDITFETQVEESRELVDMDDKPAEFHAKKPGDENLHLTPAEDMVIPKVGNLCYGDEVTITNSNNRYLVIQNSIGERFNIAPKTTATFHAEETGEYKLGFFVDCKFYEKERFVVNEKPTPNIEVDLDTKYERGIPTTKVKATGTSESYTWTSEGQTYEGRSANFHFFKEGNHTIKLTAKNGSCSVSKETTVYVEDYNLMAVTGFNPNDNDPRNSTFIPYALTQRDVKFRMIILDARTGDIVYETTTQINLGMEPMQGLEK